MKALLAVILLGLLVGCSAETKDRTTVGVVSSWTNLGIYLPTAEDVAFMRSKIPESLEALRMGLAHENQHVRMSSAYVAAKLGPQAGALVPDLLRRLHPEPTPIVRVYFASALADIGDVYQEGVQQLRVQFQSEQHGQAKTHLAGALVRLGSVQAEPDAWQWLLRSLEVFPPEPPADLDEQQIFWERRWAAVEHLRRIHGKEEVLLPLLKALRDHPKLPRWVIDQQVSVAIREIESRTKSLERTTGSDERLY